MIKRLLLQVIFLAFTLSLAAQVPQGFNYQAVVRNSVGAIIPNKAVGIRISILKDSANGSIAYSETFSKTTSASGLVNMVIGSGQPVTGTFSAINWASGVFYTKTEFDVAGGTNYISFGTTQLMSVPFALYALNAGNTNASSSVQVSQGVKVGFSSNTTWVCPTGVTQITVELWGGSGGSGGGYSGPCCADPVGSCRTAAFGGNGGDGGYTKQSLSVTPSVTYFIQIGEAGAIGISTTNYYQANPFSGITDGTSGGNTIFGNNLLIASGGSGGKSATGSICNNPTRGSDGASGSIINFINITSADSRDYIPTSYISQYPSINIGGKGNSFLGRSNGQAGFCVINY